MTGETRRAFELRELACAELLPHAQTPRETLENLNDTSIGYDTVLRVFEEWLERRSG